MVWIKIKWVYYDRFPFVHDIYPFLRWFRVVKKLLNYWQLRGLITSQWLDCLFSYVKRTCFSLHQLLTNFFLERSSYFLSLYIYTVPINKPCKVPNLLLLCNWNTGKSDSLWNEHLCSFLTTWSLWRQNHHPIQSSLLYWLLLGSHYLI